MAGSPPAARVERLCAAAVGLAMVAWASVFASQSWQLYGRFGLLVYDLAIFDQATWLISHGQTALVTVRGLHILADHFSPVLYLIAPLYPVWPDARALLALQVVALAAGAAPVYALASRATASAPLGLVFGLAYLLYPAVQWTALFEFHAEMLAVPALLAALACLLSRRRRAYLAYLVLAALTKETVGLSIVALAPFALAVDRQAGWRTLAVGVAALTVAMATTTRMNGGPSPYFAVYSRYGGSPGSVARHVATQPLATVADLDSGANREYLADTLRPVLALPLLAPGALLPAVPPLLLNLLSERRVMHSIQYQYTALVTPFVLAASVLGFARWRRWGNRFTTGLALAFLVVCVGQGAARGPLLTRGWRPPGLTAAGANETRALLAAIPPTASVSAQAAIAAHLAHRRAIHAFPNPFHRVATGPGAQALRQMQGEDYAPCSEDALDEAVAAAPVEYVALCPATTLFPASVDLYHRCAIAVLRSPAYGIVALGLDTVILRRGAPRAEGLRLLSRRSGTSIGRPADGERAWMAWVRAGGG